MDRSSQTLSTNQRRVDRLLAEYGESHKNETNKLVHWICVPMIVWAIFAMLWALPTPGMMSAIPGLNWAMVALVLAVGYYLALSVPLAAGFALFGAFCILLTIAVQSIASLWLVAGIVFFAAWAAQFWGHKVEGKKPSFLKDIQFLLVGPAWLLHFLYRRAGWAY